MSKESVLWFCVVFSSYICLVGSKGDFLSTSLPQFPDVTPERDVEEMRSHGMHHHPPPWPSDDRHTVQHAGLPRKLAVYPVPLLDSQHELCFNVSWIPPLWSPATDYSLEVQSMTPTIDCEMQLCYEYNIPGDARWWMIPARPSPVVGGCAVRPGCAYSVRLIAHPWDGHTSANLHVELDECVSGICSCAHGPRLPAPRVSASTVSMQGELFVNVSWTVPPPRYPLRLPPALQKRAYFVSIGKQMVSNAHPSPWFAHTITKQVDTDGAVADGESLRWVLLPVADKKEREHKMIELDVKLLARVSLLDERGCMGPSGNSTAYDPEDARKIQFTTYALWASLGAASTLAIVALLVLSTRSAKRALLALRPAPAPATSPAPLEPLRTRPAWLPLQLRP